MGCLLAIACQMGMKVEGQVGGTGRRVEVDRQDRRVPPTARPAPSSPDPSRRTFKMAQKLASKQSQAISLKGSTKIVCEFFDFSVVRPITVPSPFLPPSSASLSSLARPGQTQQPGTTD